MQIWHKIVVSQTIHGHHNRAGISPDGLAVEVIIMRGVPTVSMENNCTILVGVNPSTTRGHTTHRGAGPPYTTSPTVHIGSSMNMYFYHCKRRAIKRVVVVVVGSVTDS